GTQGTGGCGVGGIGGWFGAGTSGGGWYGGGGAAETGAGGGGSGYCDKTQLECLSGASGQHIGNGVVKICWGNDSCG
ncbi:MAG: hypothetical protein LBH46_02995, partial [Rickettsiales bacterium]|nr:hypothetical protein [Rickettsiales bacterium]